LLTITTETLQADIEHLENEVKERDEHIARLIEDNVAILRKNDQLLNELNTKDERAILCIRHKDAETSEEEMEQILMMLYQEAAFNRLCLATVKDKRGKVKLALCGTLAKAGAADTDEAPEVSLFPIFLIEDMCKVGAKFKFPGPDGEWHDPGTEIEVPNAKKVGAGCAD